MSRAKDRVSKSFTTNDMLAAEIYRFISGGEIIINFSQPSITKLSAMLIYNLYCVFMV